MEAVPLVLLHMHDLRDMAAFSVCCKEVSSSFKDPGAWSKQVAVAPFMLKNLRCQLEFLEWWYRVCSNPLLHVSLWQAFQWLLADNADDYAYLCAQVLTTGRCSHDLGCVGFFRCNYCPLKQTDNGVCGLIATNTQRRKTVTLGEKENYLTWEVVFTDGPVPPGPFTFRLDDINKSPEFRVGYFPWPPTEGVFDPSQDTAGVFDPGIQGSVYCVVDIEGDEFFDKGKGKGKRTGKGANIVDLNVEFELSMSCDRLVHIRQVSQQDIVEVDVVHEYTRRAVVESTTGEYGVYFCHNCNSLVMTLP